MKQKCYLLSCNVQQRTVKEQATDIWVFIMHGCHMTLLLPLRFVCFTGEVCWLFSEGRVIAKMYNGCYDGNLK
jgi:hypothetical protein